MKLLTALAIPPEEYRPLDREFGAFLARLTGSSPIPEMAELGQYLSYRIRCGHTHVALDALPNWEFWRELLQSPVLNNVVTSPQSSTITPLVLTADNRLYLRKYYNYELEVATKLQTLAARPLQIPQLTPSHFKEIFAEFREAVSPDGVNYQKMAVYNALSRDFAVISGGPGTGKTTVAAALLALELERNPQLQIILSAPTGKAKARLQEAIQNDSQKLHIAPELRDKLNKLPCHTIHALLQANPLTGTYRFNQENPLNCELLLLDECSMIPLTLMAHLLRALPPTCRIVLLGDRYQLSSVEAGAILGDICDNAPVNCFAPEIAQGFFQITGTAPRSSATQLPLAGVVAELEINQRFAAAPTIGQVANLVRTPQPDSAQFIWSRQAPDFSCQVLKNLSALEPYLQPWRNMVDLATNPNPDVQRQAFEAQNQLQVLTVMNQGPWGVQNWNKIIASMLKIPDFNAPGTPVIVRVNQQKTGLNNGDVGLICRQNGQLKFTFPQFAHNFSAGAMPPWEPVWAMTVHKAQGSGYDRVIIILPDQPTPVLTRELLYTGITRARREVIIFGRQEIIDYALNHPTRRDSGLAAMWQ